MENENSYLLISCEFFIEPKVAEKVNIIISKTCNSVLVVQPYTTNSCIVEITVFYCELIYYGVVKSITSNRYLYWLLCGTS